MSALTVTLGLLAYLLLCGLALMVFYKQLVLWSAIAAHNGLDTSLRASGARRAIFAGITDADAQTKADLRRLRAWAILPLAIFFVPAVLLSPIFLLLLTPPALLAFVLQPVPSRRATAK